MLRGYAELAVANRALVSVLACDPSVITLLREQPHWAQLITRQLALLAGDEPAQSRRHCFLQEKTAFGLHAQLFLQKVLPESCGSFLTTMLALIGI